MQPANYFSERTTAFVLNFACNAKISLKAPQPIQGFGFMPWTTINHTTQYVWYQNSANSRASYEHNDSVVQAVDYNFFDSSD